MRPTLLIVVVGLVLSCVAARAHAQEQPPKPGTRMRLTLPAGLTGQPTTGVKDGSARLEGTLVRVQGDSLTLESSGTPTNYDLNAITRLEISQGRRSHAFLGAGLGLLAGVGITYAVLYSGGSTSLCDRSQNQDAMSTDECTGLTALGGVAGAGLGALIGGRFHSERWEEAPVGRLRVGWWPGGVLGLAVTF